MGAPRTNPPLFQPNEVTTKALATVGARVARGLIGAILALGLAVGSNSVAVAGAEPSTGPGVTVDRCIRIGGLRIPVFGGVCKEEIRRQGSDQPEQSAPTEVPIRR
jgi:hypothetical protein